MALIVGEGQLPRILARAARRHGRRVAAVAFEGLSDAGLGSEVDTLNWLPLGQLDALIATLHGVGAADAVLAGKVSKTRLFTPGGIQLDERARTVLEGLADLRDDAILRAVADALETEGIQVRAQADFVPELLAPEGPLGQVAPTPSQLADVAFVWPIAKAIGALDIGQTVVVRNRAVLAVEAIEGTDAAIRRGGELGGAGSCVVKVVKPGQDPRFDLPAIGPDTLASLAAARAALLAVEASRTLVLEREELVRQADANGVCLLGVANGEAIAGARP